MTETQDDLPALIESLRADAGDYAKYKQGIPMSHDLEWDARNVRAWEAAEALSRMGWTVEYMVREGESILYLGDDVDEAWRTAVSYSDLHVVVEKHLTANIEWERIN